MGFFLVILSTIIVSQAHAEAQNQWQTSLTSSLSTNKRITFGTAEIAGSTSDAIEKAKLIAKSEMIKTFSVKISSKSIQESVYNRSSEKSDSSKVYLQNSILEKTEEIELVGLDISNVNINSNRGIVEVAAILDLTEYERFLLTNINLKIKSAELINTKNICTLSEDLRQSRKKLVYLTSAESFEQILATFSSHFRPTAYIRKQEQTELIQRCRKTWNIRVKNAKSAIKDFVSGFLALSGFSFDNEGRRKLASSKNISISVENEFSKPESIFGKMNITGKIRVTVSIDSDKNEFMWTSPTLRQSETDLKSAERKLTVRLEDQAIRGIKLLFEEHL